MTKYTFICEQDASPYGEVVESKRTVEFYADSLNQILSEFETFLRGSGYHFDGNIDIVEEESYEEYREETQFDFSEMPQNNWPFKEVHFQSDDVVEKASER